MTHNQKKQPHTISYARTVGPWISYDQVPDLGKEFEINSDPSRSKERQDLQKSEKQRRDEAAAQRHNWRIDKPKMRGSKMVDKDQPKPALRPPQPLRWNADRQSFEKRWLAEDHQAAMAPAAPKQSGATQTLTTNPNHKRPIRSR